jgi:hypothetical protein
MLIFLNIFLGIFFFQENENYTVFLSLTQETVIQISWDIRTNIQY